MAGAVAVVVAVRQRRQAWQHSSNAASLGHGRGSHPHRRAATTSCLVGNEDTSGGKRGIIGESTMAGRAATAVAVVAAVAWWQWQLASSAAVVTAAAGSTLATQRQQAWPWQPPPPLFCQHAPPQWQ